MSDAISVYSKALKLASTNDQCVGEKCEYFVTLAQLEELLTDPKSHGPVEYPSSPQDTPQPDRLKLAESLEHAARYFYGEQYGDEPLDLEMVLFAAKFAACQLTGYKTEEEVGSEVKPRTTPKEEHICKPSCHNPCLLD